MRHVVDKARATGNDQVLVCERGTSFGYNYLILNMRALAILRETGCPVVFDATHSHADAERAGHSSGAEREFVPVLARAAMAVGIAGIFMETHPRPGGPERWTQRLAPARRRCSKRSRRSIWRSRRIAIPPS
jgi:2-dehydro-3-deoxyphosphooctonate aldolase (KDO 8-P synthase)